MASELTKKQKKRLRQLAGTAYERELSEASKNLLTEFLRWQENEIDVFELNEKIHQFHNGDSRRLYTKYVGMDPRSSVAQALKEGILDRSEVEDDIYSLVSNLIEVLSSTVFK